MQPSPSAETLSPPLPNVLVSINCSRLNGRLAGPHSSTGTGDFPSELGAHEGLRLQRPEWGSFASSQSEEIPRGEPEQPGEAFTSPGTRQMKALRSPAG